MGYFQYVRFVCGLLVLFIFISCRPVWAIERNEPVVVKADSLVALKMTPLEQVAVYRVQGGRFEKIPFQIDEKVYDAKQRQYVYALEHVLIKDGVLLPGNQHLDGEDEIVFLSKSLGARATVPEKSLSPLYELAVTDPYLKVTKYAYIGAAPPTPLAAVLESDTVSYDVAHDDIRTSRYETRFLAKAPIAQAELVLANRRDGSIENVLDRFKMRFFLDLRMFFNLRFQEEEITSKRLGYTAGPIRLIRRLLVYQKLGPIRVTPKAISDYIFYSDRVLVPSTVFAPFDAKDRLKVGSYAFGGFDFSQHIYGSRFYTEHNPTPMIVDGTMSAAEKTLHKEDINWWALTGDKGHIIVKVSVDNRLKAADVSPSLYYDDNAQDAAPPESEVGQSMIGFSIDPQLLPKGAFTLQFYHYYPPKDFKIGDESVYLNPAYAPQTVIKEVH